MKDPVKDASTRTLLDRREFTAASVMALLSGVAITVSACGGGGGYGGGSSSSDDGYGGPTGGSSVATDGIAGSISSNHGHTATLTSAELNGGAAVTLHIRGAATHDHTVELSAEEVGQAAGGQRVVKRSSNTDSHFHEVQFN